MVIYRGSDGKPGYHQTDDIHDAVGFVESMRNEQGVEHARIFRLEEVVFQYKPYYRVELADGRGEQVDGSPAPTKGAATANGAGGSSGGAGETRELAPGDGPESVSPLDAPADAVSDPVPSGSGPVADNGGSDPADDPGGTGSKRGLFGR